MLPRGQANFHLPSDLLGFVAAEYDSMRSDTNWDAAVSPACTRLRAALQKLGPRKSIADGQLDILSDGLQWMQDYVNKALKSLLIEEHQPVLRPWGVERSDQECRIRIRRADLCVRFGDIRSCDGKTPGAVVALPANEYFDDDCVNDTRSSLGAYMQHAFPGRIAEVQQLIAHKLANPPSELVEREPNEVGRSYGAAKCVYLKDPLSSGRNLIFVSVTTKRAGVGLRSEARYLFAAMKAICREMNDHRYCHELVEAADIVLGAAAAEGYPLCRYTLDRLEASGYRDGVSGGANTLNRDLPRN